MSKGEQWGLTLSSRDFSNLDISLWRRRRVRGCIRGHHQISRNPRPLSISVSSQPVRTVHCCMLIACLCHRERVLTGEVRDCGEEGEDCIRKKRGANQHTASRVQLVAQLKLARFRVAWWSRVGPVHTQAPFIRHVVFGPGRCCLRGKVYPGRPPESEMRHCTPRRYMHTSGMSGASALRS